LNVVTWYIYVIVSTTDNPRMLVQLDEFVTVEATEHFNV